MNARQSGALGHIQWRRGGIVEPRAELGAGFLRLLRVLLPADGAEQMTVYLPAIDGRSVTVGAGRGHGYSWVSFTVLFKTATMSETMCWQGSHIRPSS